MILKINKQNTFLLPVFVKFASLPEEQMGPARGPALSEIGVRRRAKKATTL
jgi:hypothetical protein